MVWKLEEVNGHSGHVLVELEGNTFGNIGVFKNVIEVGWDVEKNGKWKICQKIDGIWKVASSEVYDTRYMARLHAVKYARNYASEKTMIWKAQDDGYVNGRVGVFPSMETYSASGDQTRCWNAYIVKDNGRILIQEIPTNPSLRIIKDKAEEYLAELEKQEQIDAFIIRHRDTLQTTEAWNYVPIAIVELQQNGYWSLQNNYPSGEDKVVAAYHNKEFAGFISYREYTNTKSYWITMAYVLPRFRRMGLHTLMFNALVLKAENKGILCVESATSVKNKAAQGAFEKQGRKVDSLYYVYRLKDYDTSENIDKNLDIEKG